MVVLRIKRAKIFKAIRIVSAYSKQVKSVFSVNNMSSLSNKMEILTLIRKGMAWKVAYTLLCQCEMTRLWFTSPEKSLDIHLVDGL